jgi:hypothetical protein
LHVALQDCQLQLLLIRACLGDFDQEKMSFSRHHRALNAEQPDSVADQPQAIAVMWACRGIHTLAAGPPVRSRSASRAP